MKEDFSMKIYKLEKPVKPTLKDFAIGAVVLVPFVYLLINKKGGRK